MWTGAATHRAKMASILLYLRAVRVEMSDSCATPTRHDADPIYLAEPFRRSETAARMMITSMKRINPSAIGIRCCS